MTSSTAAHGSATAHAPEDSGDELLQHHFDNLDQQHDASMLAMWTFLATEVLFFGGLIMAYVVYRTIYHDTFRLAGHRLDVWMGGLNTVILLTSSLTMALAVRAAQLHRRKQVVWYLIGTIVFGTGFLVVKGFEWHHDYELNLIPFVNFKWDPHATGHGEAHGDEAGVVASQEPDHPEAQPATVVPTTATTPRPDWYDPEISGKRGPFDPYLERYRGNAPRADDEQRAKLFFVLYFFMTGLHALHLIIGIVLVAIIAALVWRGWLSGVGETHVEVTGLYWHFIDIVWVFLYPLLYLIDLHK